MKNGLENKNSPNTKSRSKILVLGLTLVILVGIFVPVFQVHAQACTVQGATCTVTSTGASGTCQTSRASGGGLFCAANNQAAAAEANQGKGGQSFSPWNLSLDGLWLSFLGLVFETILRLMSFILYISAALLNFVLNYTIIQMKTHIDGLTGINIAWKVIRDLMNMAFIFMLVYEGIKLIIGQSNTTQIKKFITGIVMASLLINFSLFFTKILIDASNIVTIGFYKSILGPEPTVGFLSIDYGLSNPITKALGLSTIYDPNIPSQFGAGEDTWGIVAMGFGGGAVILITSFVFFAVSILFIVRYITLIILLMLSPVAYMGMALPFMGSYAKDWWTSLRGQLLFGPIYMIMTWVVLTLMASPGFITPGGANFPSVLNAQSAPPIGAMGVLLNFAVIIGLLIASIIIAKSTAKQGSDLIGNATGKITAFAGGAVLGGAARLSRNTIGRMANASANSEKLKERAARGGVGGAWARMNLAAANKAATSSFDVRATKSLGTLGTSTGFNFGKVDSAKENFRAEREARDKEAAKKMDMYKPSDGAMAEAKEKDEEIKREKEEAEKKFKDNEFSVEKEKERRSTIEKTEKWKNSAEAKAEEKAKEEAEAATVEYTKAVEDQKKAVTDLTKGDEKMATLQKEVQQAILSGNKQKLDQVQADIKNLNTENETKKKQVDDLKKLADEKKGVMETKKKVSDDLVKNWKSDEMKAAEKAKGRDEKENENALNLDYKNRVNSIAARVGHEESDASKEARRKLGDPALAAKIKEAEEKIKDPTLTTEQKNAIMSEAMKEPERLERIIKEGSHNTRSNTALRGAGFVVGTILATAGVRDMPRLKKDRESLARKMRAAARGKTKTELLAEAALAKQKEDDEVKEKDKPAETTPAPVAAPATPPPPPPPPSTPPAQP